MNNRYQYLKDNLIRDYNKSKNLKNDKYVKRDYNKYKNLENDPLFIKFYNLFRYYKPPIEKLKEIFYLSGFNESFATEIVIDEYNYDRSKLEKQINFIDEDIIISNAPIELSENKNENENEKNDILFIGDNINKFKNERKNEESEESEEESEEEYNNIEMVEKLNKYETSFLTNLINTTPNEIKTRKRKISSLLEYSNDYDNDDNNNNTKRKKLNDENDEDSIFEYDFIDSLMYPNKFKRISQEEFDSRLQSAYEDELTHEEYSLNRPYIINEKFISESVDDFNDDDYNNIPNETDKNLKILYSKSQKLDRVERRKISRRINRQNKRRNKAVRNKERRDLLRYKLNAEEYLTKLKRKKEFDLKNGIKLFHRENLQKFNNEDYSIPFEFYYETDSQKDITKYIYYKYLIKNKEQDTIYFEYTEYLNILLKELKRENTDLYKKFKEEYKIDQDDYSEDDILPDILFVINFNLEIKRDPSYFHVEEEDLIEDENDIPDFGFSVRSNPRLYLTYKERPIFMSNTYEDIKNSVENSDENSLNTELNEYYNSYKLSLINSHKNFI